MPEKELLSFLVCPKCKGTLSHEKDALICQKCRLKYHIKEGVPDMLIKDAEKF